MDLSENFWGSIWQLKGVRAYLICMLIFWIASAVMLAIWGYEDSFLLLNRIRFPLGDYLAPHLTHFGDGLLLLGIMGLLISPFKAHWNWAMLVTMLSILAVILLCKNVLFEDWNRPLIVFSGRSDFYYNSLSVLKYHAFPSGHSAGVAGGMSLGLLALLPPKTWQGIALAFFTITVAMTRLYIGVHFLGDVLVGTLIGTIIAFAVGGNVGKWLDGLKLRYDHKSLPWFQLSGAILAICASLLAISLLIARYY
ncbi:MAG: phosphatase PAP2 family protein [Bacteroidia bacterium]|nr:phosphatase PAP2 family protein [Bacteroidia bacterium]